MSQHLLLLLVILGNFRGQKMAWVLVSGEPESRTPGFCVGSGVSEEEGEEDVRKKEGVRCQKGGERGPGRPGEME